MEYDMNTNTTTNALHMHARRVSQYPDNAVGETHVVIECSWSQHQDKASEAGVQ